MKYILKWRQPLRGSFESFIQATFGIETCQLVASGFATKSACDEDSTIRLFRHGQYRSSVRRGRTKIGSLKLHLHCTTTLEARNICSRDAVHVREPTCDKKPAVRQSGQRAYERATGSRGLICQACSKGESRVDGSGCGETCQT